MSEMHFDDPHIQGRATLTAGEYQMTVPAYLSGEMDTVAEAVRERASAYYQGDRDPLRVIGEVFENWADPDNPTRREALPVLADLSGFSQEAIARFGLWPLGNLGPSTPALEMQRVRLSDLLASGNYRAFTRWGDGWIRAYGTAEMRQEPETTLLLHSLDDPMIGPIWLSLLYGLGGRAGHLLRFSETEPVSYLYLLRSIQEIDPQLRATMACGYSPVGSDTQRQLLDLADVVFALGPNATLDALQADIDRLSPSTRLLPHGPKIGFQVIGREYAREDAAELVAWGASACDGSACFSPANVYVERGGQLDPLEFAEAVAHHMGKIADIVPPKRSLAAAERITGYRHQQLQRRLLGERVTMLKSTGTDWTVVVDEEDPRLAPTCQERTIAMKPVDSVDEVRDHVRHLGDNLQTAGLAVETERLLAVADDLGVVGVTNLKMLGTEYIIRFDEPHDGIFDPFQLTMSDGLRWTHLAFTDTDQALAAALHENRTATEAALGRARAGVAGS